MNIKYPLISVIVPIYKVEKYIDTCLISILNQTYKNLEIILVDDGSPDNCPAICDQYASQDSRIKVIHKVNGGISSARNGGLAIALGQYVAFVDPDDSIREDYVDVLYSALRETNCQIAVGNHIIVQEDESIKNDVKLNEPLRIYTKFEAVDNMYDYITSLSIQFITVWGNLYDMQLFKTLKFPIGKIHEDEFVNYKLFFMTEKIVYSSEQLYYYLNRKESIKTSKYSLAKLAKLEALEERVLFFENLKIIKLRTKSQYLYYRTLLSQLYLIKFTFPDEKVIYKSLRVKHHTVSKELLLNNGIHLKQKLIIILFFLFPKLYKYKISF
jgi:glycosyltransferase involved in cell wall biosynthesis